MIKMIEINDSQFNILVFKSALPVLLECASPECIICKTMAERIQEAGKGYGSKMIFLRINVNENKKWKDFDVRVIPTLLYFKNGILSARQDNFPEVEEIRAQMGRLVKREERALDFSAELKTALDLEDAATKFYEYVSGSAKNGKVKEKFRLIHQESAIHKELLSVKLRELTGEPYAGGAGAQGQNRSETRPQSFSLMGALKMAVKIEERLLVFYKGLSKRRLFADQGLFKRLIKEEGKHLKELQREIRFGQDNELLAAMEPAQSFAWVSEAFKGV